MFGVKKILKGNEFLISQTEETVKTTTTGKAKTGGGGVLAVSNIKSTFISRDIELISSVAERVFQ